jgi:RHS repeat-associated protein
MLVPNRYYVGAKYRYGFQGQEKDDELKGEGNSLNYTFRMHDPRVGRFFARDPLEGKYPFYSPYQFSGNRVIDMIELEGLEPTNTKVNADSQPKGDYWEKTDSAGNYTGEAYPKTELAEITVTAAKRVNVVTQTLQVISSGMGEIGGALTGASSISPELNSAYNAKYAPSTDPYAAAAVCAAPVVVIGFAELGVGALIYEGGSSLWTSEVASYRALWAGLRSNPWTTSAIAAYGSANNALSQYFANGNSLGDINIMESGFSALPGYGATVLGEGFKFSWNKRTDGITSDFTSYNALLSIGGGVFSNFYGGKTDDYLTGEKGGWMTKEFFKFQIETATNAAPDALTKK